MNGSAAYRKRVQEERRSPLGRRRKLLDPEARARLRRAHADGVSVKDCAARFGVSWDTAKAAIGEEG